MRRKGDARARVAAGWAAAALLALSGCKASAYYDAAEKQRGSNPHAAIEYLSRCLEVDPQNEKGLAMLNELGKKMAVDHAEKENELDRSGKYADAVAECDRMMATKELISHCPGGVDVAIEPAERTKFAEKAAEKCYKEATNLKAQDAKKAARSFRLCIAFSGSYKDAQAQYEECLKAAKLLVTIHEFEGSGDYGPKITRDVTDRFRTKVVDKKPEFLEIVDQAGAGTGKITGKVSATYRDSGWKSKSDKNTIEVEARNDDGSRKKDANGNSIMENVTCQWTVHERATSLDLTVSYEVRDAGGASKSGASSSQKDGDQYKYVDSVRGDERALPSHVSSLPREKKEPRGAADLAGGCVNKAIEDCCQKLFRSFK